jgi:hypothetical protein
MMLKKASLATASLALAFTLTLTACSDDSGTKPSADPEVKILCNVNGACVESLTLQQCLEANGVVQNTCVPLSSSSVAAPGEASSSSAEPPPQPSSSSIEPVPEPSSSSVTASSSSESPSSSSSIDVPPTPSSSSEAPSSSSSVYVPPSSSSVALEPDAIVITLTNFVQNVAQDALGGAIDPRIKALTYAYRAGDLLKADTSKLLLNAEDRTTWTGSVADTMNISYAGAYPDSLYAIIRVNDADITSQDLVMNCQIGFNATEIYRNARYTGISCANPNSVDVTVDAKFIRK